jgi:hypothetical protein
MESEANKILIPSPDNVNPCPHFHEDILRHVATFLDFQSLLQFRLVSHEWNDVGLPILMKKGYYNFTHSRHGNERPDLLKGAIHYSS